MVSDQLEEAVFLFLVYLEKSMYKNESETCLGLGFISIQPLGYQPGPPFGYGLYRIRVQPCGDCAETDLSLGVA